MEVRDERELLTKKVNEIVASLGDGYTVDNNPDVWGVNISGPDKMKLYVNLNRHNDRLVIYGSWNIEPGLNMHNYLRYDRPSTEITVSVKKTGETIANDMKRRLIPVYKELLAEALENKRIHDETVTRKRETLKAVAEAGSAEYRETNEHDMRVIKYNPYHVEAKATGGYGTELEIEMTVNVPVELAAKIAKLVNDNWEESHGKEEGEDE